MSAIEVEQLSKVFGRPRRKTGPFRAVRALSLTGVLVFALAASHMEIDWMLALVLFDTEPRVSFLDDVFRRFGSYPLHLFGNAVLGRIAPLVSGARLISCYAFWRPRIRQCQSTGH